MKVKRVFIKDRGKLEHLLQKYQPAVKYLAAYTIIAHRANEVLIGSTVKQIDSSIVNRMYNRLTIQDEYTCRVVLRVTQEHFEEVKRLIKTANLGTSNVLV